MNKKSIINNNQYLLLIAISIIVGMMNVVYCTNRSITMIFVLLEVLILIYLFASRKYIDYLGMYILFCGLSNEYEKLIGNDAFYGFKNTRILGVNLGILALLPLFVVAFRKISIDNNSLYGKFYKYFMLLQVCALIIGFTLVVVNDNGVQAFSNVFGLFFENLYVMSAQQILLATIFLFFVNNCIIEDLVKIEDYFLCLLIGVISGLVFSFVSGKQGVYGGVQTLMASNNVRWLPMMFLLPIYPKYKNKISIWILGLVGAVLVLAYNSTGKMIIMYYIVPIIYFAINIKSKQYKRAISILLLFPLILFVLMFGANYFAESNILFRNKLSQTLSIINYINGNVGVDEVSSSPRVRILEIRNILIEYFNKPWLVVLGKGFFGTVKNYTGMRYTTGAYSIDQWRIGLFYRMHESFSKLLLCNGLSGVVFLVTQLYRGVKNISKTPWGAVGLYWLLICYGHSITMTAFGFSCFLYSIIQVDVFNERELYSHI